MGITSKDVRQIAYETGLWAIDIERLNNLKPSDVEFKEKFDNWIEGRIKMITKTI